MKNQYFGDINDYIKYGILRMLSSDGKMPIHVCWMLTPNDNGKDGKKRDYFRNPSAWNTYDRELFNVLEQTHLKRDVMEVEKNDLIPKATFYAEMLQNDRAFREQWFEEFLRPLTERGLIFFDPDNGMETKSKCNDPSKYLYWSEIYRTYERGHSLLIFNYICHFLSEQNRERMIQKNAERLRLACLGSDIHFFRTYGDSVVYFLVVQPDHINTLEAPCCKIVQQWAPKAIRKWGRLKANGLWEQSNG